MYDCLIDQKKIHSQFKCEYFFYSSNGKQINLSHLRQRVWTPALEQANLGMREMKQTRHSFATIALSCGENPLWIAKIMGHSNAEMVTKVCGKYIENAVNDNDGKRFNELQEEISKNE